jgi:hypothetical protein
MPPPTYHPHTSLLIDHQQSMRDLYKAVFRFPLNTRRGATTALRALFRAFLETRLPRRLCDRAIPLLRRIIKLNALRFDLSQLDVTENAIGAVTASLIAELQDLLGIYNRSRGRPLKRSLTSFRRHSRPPGLRDFRSGTHQ